MHLVVNQAGIGGQMLKTRWSLYQRTRDIEKKVALMTDAERTTPVSVLFCSSGFDWHVDTLEDFADYYVNGRFRQDDWAATMMTRYMAEKDTACMAEKQKAAPLAKKLRAAHAEAECIWQGHELLALEIMEADQRPIKLDVAKQRPK